jgi:hypothetical protein
MQYAHKGVQRGSCLPAFAVIHNKFAGGHKTQRSNTDEDKKTFSYGSRSRDDSGTGFGMR